MYDIATTGWLRPSQTLEGNRLKFGLEVLNAADPSATDFLKEVDRAVCHIRNKWHNNLFLALSGGMDSEMVAEALVRNGIFFTPVLLDIDGYNKEELWWAERWCAKNGMQPVRLKADVVKLISFMEQRCVPQYVTSNLGGYINVFLADYVKKAFNGALITGCGDPTINPAGIYKEGELVEDPEFFYWDIDVLLDIMRPGQHPRSVISYFPDTLHAYVWGYNSELTEQEAKAALYGIPVRPKVDVFDKVPEWNKFLATMGRFVVTQNLKIGTKQEFLNWLTKEDSQ